MNCMIYFLFFGKIVNASWFIVISDYACYFLNKTQLETTSFIYESQTHFPLIVGIWNFE